MKTKFSHLKPQQIWMTLILFLLASVTFADIDNMTMAMSDEQSIPEYSSGEVLVKFKKNQTTITAQQAISLLGAKSAKKFTSIKNSKNTNLKRWWKLKIPKGSNVESFIEKISKNPSVEIAEPNYLLKTLTTIPNDQYFQQLWGMNNLLNDADIDAPEAWSKLTGSDDIVVAVIDSGVDYSHEELADNMWINPGEIVGNGIDDDHNGHIDDIYGANFFGENTSDPMDDNGHGTHCAGTIAALGNNEVGVTGVSWNAKIMAVKFLNSEGSGYVNDAIEAITYAIDQGAHIMSNSWGGGGYSQLMYDAISDANDAGVLFVAAAGNWNRNNDYVNFYPQGYQLPNVISVAATNSSDNKARFSHYGANTVHLGAPGVNIYSTVPIGSCRFCNNSGYRSASGTSMATPHVSGAAALLLAQSPALSVADLKAAIIDSVDPNPSMAGITISGGRLNVNNALNYAKYTVAFTSDSHAILHGTDTSYTMNVTALSGDITLDLDLQPLADGLSGAIADSTLTIPANTTVSTTITINSDTDMNRGHYPIKIALSETPEALRYAQANLQVLVPGYGISATPDTLLASRDSAVNYELTISSIDGYSGDILLETVLREPSLNSSLSTPIVSVPANGSVSSTLTVNTNEATPLQTHNIEMLAHSDSAVEKTTIQLQVVDLDLTLSEIDTPATTVNVGSSFITNFTVTNMGTTTAYDIAVDLYLSSDDIITTTDTPLATQNIAFLGGGLSAELSTSLETSSSMPPGTYYIGAIIDQSNQLPESDEENNDLSGKSIKLNSGVDFVVTKVNPNSTIFYAGTYTTVENSVENIGPTASGNIRSNLGIYLSNDTNNILLDQRTLKNLDPGQISTDNSRFFIPANLEPGNYTLTAVADRFDTLYEDDETNNTLISSHPIQVINNIDLQSTDISPATTTWHTGTYTTVSTTVTNNGHSRADSFATGLYLSRDSTVTLDDQLLHQRTQHNLDSGQSSTDSSRFFIPANLEPGDYTLGVIADRRDTFDESDETNNTLIASQTIQVIRDIDLLSSDISPTTTTWQRGTYTSVNTTVTNNGRSRAESFSTGLYLYSETGNDQLLHQRIVRHLDSGVSNSDNSQFFIPTNLEPGNYTLGVIADRYNSITENDEINNSLHYSMPITLE